MTQARTNHARTRLPSGTPERGSAAAWILALIVLGGVAFAVYWFAIRKQDATSSSLAARVFPVEVDLVGGIDIARVMNDPKLRDLAKQNGTDIAAIDAELAKAGVKLSDLEALVFGGRMGESNVKDAIVAIEASADTKALAGAMQVLITMLPEPLKGALAGARVEALDGGVALAGSGELLDKALAVSKGLGTPLGKKPGLDEVREALDTGAIMWVASAIPSGMMSMLPGMAKSMLSGTPSHFGFSAALTDGAELRAALHIPGADADQVASSIKLMLGMFKSKLSGPERMLADHLELSGTNGTLIAKVMLTHAQVSDILARTQKVEPN